MKLDKFQIPDQVPLVVSPNKVLFPGARIRIEIANNKLIRHYRRKDLELPIIGVVPVTHNQKDPLVGSVVTAAFLNQISNVFSPRKTITLTCTGLSRIRINKIHNVENNLSATVSLVSETPDEEVTDEIKELIDHLKSILAKMLHDIKFEQRSFSSLKKTAQVIDKCASLVRASFEKKIEILQATDVKSRLKIVIPLLERHSKEIGSLMDRELGDGVITMRMFDNLSSSPLLERVKNNGSKDYTELEEKLNKINLPPHAQKVAFRELFRLQKMSLYNPEYSSIRNYVELIAELPWSVSSSSEVDVNEAKEQLDKDHYGLFKLKRRVIEYLAVSKLNNNRLRGPILCFVGPPGVGKTSVGRSVANILGRKFQRISLGGISNQADIRGHRRTYIGSMPGRIIQAIRTAGTNNPVILLDEIDKLGKGGMHGIPAAALLEVLDPEQNCSFVDHYLNIPFDLSQTLFIATANDSSSIPSPLRDRLEVIKVSGYIQEEKFQIAKNYLLPKQIEMHGLKPEMLIVPDDTVNLLIKGYTKEAGVRAIERKLAALCRAVAVKVVNPKKEECEFPVLIDSEKVLEILGGSLYLEEDILNRTGVPGVAVGLACTPVGGRVLVVEATLLPSSASVSTELVPSSNLVLTGRLGEVMRESAQLALNWLRSVAHKYGLVDPGQDLLKHNGIHIHFPEGAVNKEGPSSGITIGTALMSLFTGLIVDKKMAFTGEITLQGVVLPVGGIRDKVLAAQRAGLTKIVLPKKCVHYINEIPKNILNSLDIIYVSRMSEVIEAAFNGQLTETPSLSLKCKL